MAALAERSSDLTPQAVDRIAQSGLRYTQMHSTALCSPTRAALITGRNHHSVGFGVVSELSAGYLGYDSFITKDKAVHFGRSAEGCGGEGQGARLNPACSMGLLGGSV